jgi:hypothetical protein
MDYGTHTRHNQPGTVAVVFDPEGGEHPCMELGHPWPRTEPQEGPFYWCAGMVARSPGLLADHLWSMWDAQCDYAREWDELRAMESRIP